MTQGVRKVGVLFLNGGAASTAIVPAEVFRYAGVFWNVLQNLPPAPPFEVHTASIDGGAAAVDPIVQLLPETSVDALDDVDLVFVPAAGLPFETMVADGYDVDAVIEANAAIVPRLRKWHARGARIAAVCSGVALLAASGLLDGRRATAHWGLVPLYRARFPAIDWQPGYLVVDEGDLYSGGGINAAADLALYLVEKYASAEVARQCAKSLLIEMPRTWQTAFSDFALDTAHGDPAIARAQERLHAEFATEVHFDALAADLGMSPRTFARRFRAALGQSPLAYLQMLRIAAAKRHLENGRAGIHQVMAEVGYEDAIFFRRLFKRHTGLTPSEYRRRFARPGAA